MKKRLKGLLVLWLAFLMVLSMPMTANAAISNIILYDGTDPLKAYQDYKYDDIYKDKFKVLFADPVYSQDGTATIPALDAFKEGKNTSINTLVGNKLSTQDGYTLKGWRIWNSTSGYSMSNPSEKATTYEFEVPTVDSPDYETSDYMKYIAGNKLELMAIEPVWELDYKITHWPDNDEPYVGLNDAGKDAVTSYQWYSYAASTFDTPYITPETSDVTTTDYEIFNAVEGVMSLNVSNLPLGYIMQITPPSGTELMIEDNDNIFSLSKNENSIWFCVKRSEPQTETRGFYVCNSAETPFTVTIKAFAPIEGQNDFVFSGSNGDCFCKVNFQNGASLYSNSFTYTRYDITPNKTTNGSFTCQVDGVDVTKAAPEHMVTIVPAPDAGYEVYTIKVTFQKPDGVSEEISVTDNTFTMPEGDVNVDVTFKKKTYGITLPEDPVGYTVKPPMLDGENITSVEHGGSYTFSVTISDGYTATENYVVKANDTELPGTTNDNKTYNYIINNVTGAQTVTVTGVNKLHDITLSESTGGSYTVTDGPESNATTAIKGTILTITPTPTEGYELDTITVIQKDGSDTAVTVDDKNQFTMPEYPVEVSVTFKKKTYGITLPQNQIGYTVKSSQVSPVEHGSDYTFQVTVGEGYDVPIALVVKTNGTALEATSVTGKEYTYTIKNVAAAQEITVGGVSDTTAPALTITLDEANSWKKFLPKVIFDLFFKEEKSLTITSTDAGSGIRSLMYYVSETDLFPNEEDYTSQDIENKISQWTEYTAAVSISADSSYVVYAKATDKAGNVTYVSTSGMVIDTTKPVISGLEDGGQYYGDTSATISDANLSTVKLDGKAVEFTGTSASVTISADGAEHTIEATDKAGNQVTYKVRVNETWVRDGISTAGPRSLKIGVPYKFGSGKWKVAGDTTVYEGGNTFYASEDGTFDFQSQ